MPKLNISFIERIAQRITLAENGCWIWKLAKNDDGYGTIKIDGVRRPAHIVTYEYCVGPVPSGLELDHLCRNRACCNPDHLEPVTHIENMRRGVAVGAVAAAIERNKTHCPQGHPYSTENTKVLHGKRKCRICSREIKRRHWNKHKDRINSERREARRLLSSAEEPVEPEYQEE